MAVILRFPIERVAPALPPKNGHRCIVIPFPQRFVSGATKSQKRRAVVKGNVPPKSCKSKLVTKAKIAQKQLGIEDADYRLLLQHNFGVNSCTELDEIGLLRLIGYYRSKGWQDSTANNTVSRPQKALDRHGKPASMRNAQNSTTPTLERIEALLCEISNCRGKYMPWDYAAGILKKQTGLDNLDMATVLELRNVMVALERTLNTERRK
jgi:Mu-like prophage protein gp16